jgi:HoxN/HupN/NixA family high-affinity nickel-transporter
VLLGTALLAYGFGLRHAVDADHIAAIDNVTRKLMQEQKRPVAVGFFFSLGHSTVVVLAAVSVALATTVIQGHFDNFKEIGGVVSTLVSSFFLFALAIMNFLIRRGIWRAWQLYRSRAKRGSTRMCDSAAASPHRQAGQSGSMEQYGRSCWLLELRSDCGDAGAAAHDKTHAQLSSVGR